MREAFKMREDKQAVQDFWEDASCGERLYLAGLEKADFVRHTQKRYELEPEILEFGNFKQFNGKRVLEIGVGLGADHQQLAEAGADLFGVDLTKRALFNTTMRFKAMGLNTKLANVDAENQPFKSDSFDAVYSWGVLHVTPDTPKAIDEVYRILKPGGTAKIMIYQTYSMIGYMLWVRYALMKLKPWRSLKYIYHHYLESLGTKTYTPKEAKVLFKKFKHVKTNVVMTHHDLLDSDAGQRHQGVLLNAARKLWPRQLIKKYLPGHGLFLTIEATK